MSFQYLFRYLAYNVDTELKSAIIPVTSDVLPNFPLANKDEENEEASEKVQHINNQEEVECESAVLMFLNNKMDDERTDPL